MRGCARTRSARTRAISFPVAAPPEWKTRATRMAALPAGLVLEVDAQVDQVDDPRRRFLGQDAHGARPAEAAAGAQRVLRVQRRRVAGTRRGGDAALGEIARRREQRAFRDQLDVCFRGGAQRSVEAGDAGADDDEIGGRFGHVRGL